MVKSVLEKFPNWRSDIELLYLESTEFQEICHDYNEVSSLVASWTDSDEVSRTKIDDYQTLLNDLETEILEDLQERFPTINQTDQHPAPHSSRFEEAENDVKR